MIPFRYIAEIFASPRDRVSGALLNLIIMVVKRNFRFMIRGFKQMIN
jgi:hypothetical protein